MTEERGRQWDRLFDLIEQLVLSLAANGSAGSAEAAMRLARRAYRQWGAELCAPPLLAATPTRKVNLLFIAGEPEITELT